MSETVAAIDEIHTLWMPNGTPGPGGVPAAATPPRRHAAKTPLPAPWQTHRGQPGANAGTPECPTTFPGLDPARTRGGPTPVEDGTPPRHPCRPARAATREEPR